MLLLRGNNRGKACVVLVTSAWLICATPVRVALLKETIKYAVNQIVSLSVAMSFAVFGSETSEVTIAVSEIDPVADVLMVPAAL